MPSDDEERQQSGVSETSPDWQKQKPTERSLWPKRQDGSWEHFSSRGLQQATSTYFLRWGGRGQSHPPRNSVYRAVLAFIGSFLSLLLISGMQQWINYHWSLPMLLATFGPAAALIFGLPQLPASQPLNCLGGTVVCGVIGLFWRVVVGREVWIAVPLSVASSVSALELMAIPFPPGLATSILMVTLVPENEFQLDTLASTHAAHNWCIRPLLEHSLLLRFTQGCKIFLAAVLGQVALLVVALLVNNLDLDSGYPNRWL